MAEGQNGAFDPLRTWASHTRSTRMTHTGFSWTASVSDEGVFSSRVAARDPYSRVFGSFGCRRREFRLSYAQQLPWRKNTVADRSPFYGGWLVGTLSGRSRSGRKLNDFAAHRRTSL
jgi:hypothetical protein